MSTQSFGAERQVHSHARRHVSVTPATTVLRRDCPVCGGEDLLLSVAFEHLPVLCNALHPTASAARTAKTGEFATVFCRDCAHVFNAAFDENRIGYTQSYENSLHFSDRFVAFSDSLVARLTRKYALEGKTIFDIGCGKGDFLKQICRTAGAKGVGFDKSFAGDREDADLDVQFINDWFDDSYVQGKADFISCRHVIEHIAEPVTFLRAIRQHPSVTPETVFYFEVPNALYTLRDLGIWDLIYEHVSYFTPPSLRAAVEAAGFELLDAGSSFGDQYLYVEARPGRRRQPPRPSDAARIEALMRKFASAYRDKLTHWRGYLTDHSPERAVVWGAGSKGITFVNVVPEADRIGALIDLNPHKQGRFAPCSATPVLAPPALRRRQIDSIIVMNPLYLDEISRAAADLGVTAAIVAA